MLEITLLNTFGTYVYDLNDEYSHQTQLIFVNRNQLQFSITLRSRRVRLGTSLLSLKFDILNVIIGMATSHLLSIIILSLSQKIKRLPNWNWFPCLKWLLPAIHKLAKVLLLTEAGPTKWPEGPGSTDVFQRSAAESLPLHQGNVSKPWATTLKQFQFFFNQNFLYTKLNVIGSK